MTYGDLQRENKEILARMEELTAIILAIDLEGQHYEYGIIREVLQEGSPRADEYRQERELLRAELDENMDRLEIFLMTAERRSQLFEILKTIKA